MSKRGRETGIDTGEEEVKKRKNATKDMDNDKHDKESDFSWATWQLIDPLLPTGGFAHSCGLEAAAHAGLVKGKYCISQIPRLFDHTILTFFWQNSKGYTGLDCATRCSPCEHGDCRLDGSCHCRPGWTMLDCSKVRGVPIHVPPSASLGRPDSRLP